MTRHAPLVFDTSAMTALFDGHPVLLRLLDDAQAGMVFLVFPTVAIAGAEGLLHAGRLWEPFLLIPGVRPIELSEHVAIHIGAWPGSLMSRQVVYEARAINGAVVTRQADAYAGIDVPLIRV